MNTSEKVATGRIEWIDIAKGIAMLCIIAGHMGIPMVDRAVFIFHVPIFFMISGYFMSLSTDIATYTKKRIRGLVIPYIFSSFCLMIAKVLVDVVSGQKNNIFHDIITIFVQAVYGSGSTANKTLFGIQPIGAIWFFLALFWALFFVKLFINKKYGMICIGLIAILSYISSKYIWLPFDIQAGGTAACFVYIGAYVKKHNIKFEIKWWLVVIGMIAFVAMYALDINLSVAQNYYKYTIVSALGAVLVSYDVLCVAKMMEPIGFLKKFLSFFGINSSIILCFHLIELNNIPWGMILSFMSGTPLALQYLVIFICKIVFVTICTMLALKSKFLRSIFGK